MKKGRVLVVDDERAIRKAVSRALSSRGFLVDVAADGEEALGSVRTFDPDLMVLDLNLPEVDGLEVCRRVRAWSAVPILVLSVRGRKPTRWRRWTSERTTTSRSPSVSTS
jgi:DNA-binding response OmpR family regulator